MCYLYPGSKWFIGRNELSRLMKSSYVTFTKVCKHHNIPQGEWSLNGQYHYIEFKNGSRIDLLDLAYKPSDPEYQRFGSLEYTGGWIEEAGEVNFAAFDILKSRIGRHKNKELGIRSKMLLTCNPAKNWLYQVFYKPSRDGELKKGYAFLQSLYDDNPYTVDEYRENLSDISNEINRRRLMSGDWEYDDDPLKIFKYDALNDMFTNTIVKKNTNKFISADIARLGDDKTVVGVWEDKELIYTETMEKQTTDVVAEKIKALASEHKVPYSRIIIDEDGIGGGVIDQLGGVKGFVANAVPFQAWDTHQHKMTSSNFQNLKAQCYFKLADLVNQRKIRLDVESHELRGKIVEELEQIKQKDPDKDRKVALIPKSEMKEILGRSPDYADMLMMRMYFEFKDDNTARKINDKYRVHVTRREHKKNHAR